MFPMYISDTVSEIEKINGITVTNYIYQMLNKDTLIHILNSIYRIQSSNLNSEGDINLYDNYALKLETRYQNYDYSSFENSKCVYESILKKLTQYEQNKLGKLTVIHGDPVFTNIIINDYGKIKFIDMRGRVGDKLTIFNGGYMIGLKFINPFWDMMKYLLPNFQILNTKKKHDLPLKIIFMNKFSEQDFENMKTITKKFNIYLDSATQ